MTIQQDNAFVLGDSFAAMALVAQHVDESSSSQISPGELIYFCRDKIAFDRPFAEEDSAHSAIFVGDGLYLSQFGPDGPIALTTARQIEELYGTRYRYRIPRRREDTEGLSLDLVSANFQHHIDQLISLFPAGTFVDVSGSDLSPDTISTRTLVDMFHALATNRDDARGVHDPYDAVVAYIQQMDTPSRLLLAELLVGKAVGQEIIDAHRSS